MKNSIQRKYQSMEIKFHLIILYFKVIAPLQNVCVFFRISTTVTWAENSNRIVQRSQTERGKSSQMRSDIDNLINICSQEVWDSWSNTNNSLARRSAETMETKNKLQMHLHKVT